MLLIATWIVDWTFLKTDIEIIARSKNLNFIEVCWSNKIFVESASEISVKWVAACLKVLCHESQD